MLYSRVSVRSEMHLQDPEGFTSMNLVQEELSVCPLFALVPIMNGVVMFMIS